MGRTLDKGISGIPTLIHEVQNKNLHPFPFSQEIMCEYKGNRNYAAAAVLALILMFPKICLFSLCVCNDRPPLFKGNTPCKGQVSGVSWRIVMQAEHPFSNPILNPALQWYLLHERDTVVTCLSERLV